MFSGTAREQRRRRGNARNPYTSTTSRQRRKSKLPFPLPVWNLSWRVWMILSSLGLGIWYGTPVVPEFVVPTILQLAVPIQADIDLGVKVFHQQSLQRQTYYDSRWTPQIQKIGYELVAVQESDKFDSQQSHFQVFGKRAVEWVTDRVEEFLEPDGRRRRKRKNQERRHNHGSFAWDFGVVNDSQVVNAFALPGGIIRVTKGLLDRLDLTQGELAALLGHEMGHVMHRHGAGQVLERRLFQTLVEAVLYEDDDPYRESWGEAIGELLLDSADWLGQRAFSRRNEYQADATSWDLLVASGKYHPKSLESLLSKLWDHHRNMESASPSSGRTSWESTHPGTLDRLQALEEKWDALSYLERRTLNKHTVH